MPKNDPPSSYPLYKRVKDEQGHVKFQSDHPAQKPGIGKRIRKRIKCCFSKRALGIIGSLLLTLVIFIIIGMIYYASLLPDISGLAAAKEQPGVEMLSEDGQILARYGQIIGKFIPYHKVPQHLIDAVIATEDRRFFSHKGLDPKGVARAMVANVKAGRLVQGGSTITQQLAKNVFLTSERTFSRKIQELMMSFWLEQKFTKQEILAIYLNRVYLGGGSYGIDSASHFYFNTSAYDLDLIESAMLAGLLKAPSFYNPTANTKRAIDRTAQVIRNMQHAGKIDESVADKAIEELRSGKRELKKESHDNQRYFTDWIMQIVPNYVGKVEDDLIVHTTLHADWQQDAEESVAEYMTDDVRKSRKVQEAALLAMKPDGAIVSMVGGMDYYQSQYNRAVQAKRQPGSAFKIFVYLAAMERGYSPEMILVDEPVTVGKWKPQNYKNRYRGQVSLQQALAYSLNTIAVKLSQFTGIARIRTVARRLGIRSEMSDMPSIALGSLEVTLKEMVTAYAHLANRGRAVKPYGITKIEQKRNRKVLYERTKHDDFSDVIVVKENDVNKMNNMLVSVVDYGTGKGASIGRSAAGKTGTASAYKDAWFIGYTPALVTGVWVGNDDASSMKNVTGGSIPARIWRSYMKKALSDVPANDLPVIYQPQQQDWQFPWQQPASQGTPLPQTHGQTHGQTQPPTQENAPAAQDDQYRLKKSFWDTLFDDNSNESSQNQSVP